MEGEKLERVYLKIKSGKASAAAVHSIGAGIDGRVLPHRKDHHFIVSGDSDGTHRSKLHCYFAFLRRTFSIR